MKTLEHYTNNQDKPHGDGSLGIALVMFAIAAVSLAVILCCN